MTAATAARAQRCLSSPHSRDMEAIGMLRNDDRVLARLHQARKSHGAVRALDGIDLTLRPGELLALLGPNGAGKTTAIGLLLGLVRADSGEVALFGRDPQDLAARRQVGVMLQDAALPPT